MSDHMNFFRCLFLSVPQEKLRLLKVKLTPDAKPVKVRLRKYTADQRRFLFSFLKTPVQVSLRSTTRSEVRRRVPHRVRSEAS